MDSHILAWAGIWCKHCTYSAIHQAQQVILMNCRIGAHRQHSVQIELAIKLKFLL